MNLSRSALILSLLLPATVAAQSGTVPLSHWQHTAWVGDRAPPLPISRSMLRSGDGYLWIGSYRGLVRFDGERFTLIDSSYTPFIRDQLNESYDPVLVDHTGRMWIGGGSIGLLSYADGIFRNELRDSGYVQSVAEFGDGQMLVAIDTRLHLLRNGRLEKAPFPREAPDTGVVEMISDNAGGVWYGTLEQGLWHVTATTAEQYGAGRLSPLLHASDGTLWVSQDRGNDRGLMRLEDGVFHQVYRPDRREPVTAGAVVEGKDGSIWIPSFSSGLLRWRGGEIEEFGARDGLSSNTTKSVLLSEEGTVWVSTDAGLDRIRPATFVPVEVRDAPEASPTSFTVDRDGALWTVVRGRLLYRHDGGIIRRSSGPVLAREQPIHGVQVNLLEILTGGRNGGLWLSATTAGSLLYYNNGRVQEYAARQGLPAARPWGVAEGFDGTLWIRFFPRGFGRIRDGKYRRVEEVEPGPENMAIDATGRLWLVSSVDGMLVAMVGDSIVDRLPLPIAKDDRIVALAHEKGDTLWMLARRSLFRVAGGRISEVEVSGTDTIREVLTKMAIANGRLWLTSEGGLAAFSLTELHRAADGEKIIPSPASFDELDGIVTPRSKGATRRPLQVGPDGRLWIATPTGFAVADDSPHPPNQHPPVIHVEEVSIAGRGVALTDGGAVPPNPERLAIRFSVPSLGLAERIRVQYQLIGADRDWVDSKAPRLATYDHLRPGRYEFRVRAWNEAGVPSNGVTTFTFRVTPAWYQANWFMALCVLAVALAGAGLAHLLSRSRLRRKAAAVEARYEAVLSERTRLARELHDTLLQGFTGLTLQIDGVRASLEEKKQDESEALSSILQRADRTLRDAREMVWDMRQSSTESTDLGLALRAEGEALANPEKVELEYVITGAPRELAPTVVTTILRIAREAMANALSHARARRVTVRLAYEAELVELEVRDDGCGADMLAVDTASARGHWGVAGMRERARSVGGTLSLSAIPGGGTRVGVQIAAVSQGPRPPLS